MSNYRMRIILPVMTALILGGCFFSTKHYNNKRLTLVRPSLGSLCAYTAHGDQKTSGLLYTVLREKIIQAGIVLDSEKDTGQKEKQNQAHFSLTTDIIRSGKYNSAHNSTGVSYGTDQKITVRVKLSDRTGALLIDRFVSGEYLSLKPELSTQYGAAYRAGLAEVCEQIADQIIGQLVPYFYQDRSQESK